MNNITQLFGKLKLSKRILVGFADTEGAPHRKDGTSSLWNLVIIFKHIVDEDFNELESCMHVTHFAMPKNLEKRTVTKPLKTHISAINHIRDEHKCDEVVLGFWNAPHDNAVLKYYDVLTDFKTVDLLKCARECSGNKYESYSIGKLCKQFNVMSDEDIHTGLGDTLRMIKILPRVGITSVRFMKPYINQKTKSITHKNVKKKRSSNNGFSSTSKKSETTNDTRQTKSKAKSRSPRRRSNKGVAEAKNSTERRTEAMRRATARNSKGTKSDIKTTR